MGYGFEETMGIIQLAHHVMNRNATGIVDYVMKDDLFIAVATSIHIKSPPRTECLFDMLRKATRNMDLMGVHGVICKAMVHAKDEYSTTAYMMIEEENPSLSEIPNMLIELARRMFDSQIATSMNPTPARWPNGMLEIKICVLCLIAYVFLRWAQQDAEKVQLTVCSA